MSVEVLSDKQQRFNGTTYYKCGFYFQKKGVRLHKMVWEHYNGKTPDGYHVHHKDGNRSNNDISNLELKLKTLHMSDHGKAPARDEYNQMNIKRIRALASEWHGSEAGRKWHGEHATEMWESKETRKYICEFCGAEFESRSLDTAKVKFCSSNCKGASRWQSGVDNVERTCDWCGKKYVVNKRSKGMTCSMACRAKKRWSGYESKGGTTRR